MTRRRERLKGGVHRTDTFKRQIEPKNGGQKRSVHSVSLQKSYLDGEGTRQYTGNLDLGDLPAATTVLDLATKFIVEQEADVTP